MRNSYKFYNKSGKPIMIILSNYPTEYNQSIELFSSAYYKGTIYNKNISWHNKSPSGFDLEICNRFINNFLIFI